MKHKVSNPTFWVTNISQKDVYLEDLGVRVRAMTSINLADYKHYPHLTWEILNKSEISGSLFKKQKSIKHRKVEPELPKKNYIELDTNAAIPTRQHSGLEIKEEQYDELNIVDDDVIASINNVAPPTK